MKPVKKIITDEWFIFFEILVGHLRPSVIKSDTVLQLAQSSHSRKVLEKEQFQTFVQKKFPKFKLFENDYMIGQKLEVVVRRENIFTTMKI